MENQARVHPSGAYRYLPAISAYSSGIAAEPGHSIVGLRFAAPTPLEAALVRIDQELAQRGAPQTALAGLQLRSPAVMSGDVFGAFNERYLSLLDDRGILLDGSSPLSRTNVVPVYGAYPEPVVHSAFLVLPSDAPDGGDFVVAGSGEAVGGIGPEHITAYADISPAAIRAKTETVVDVMVERIVALGHSAGDPTEANVYTVHETPGLATLLSARMPACEWSGYIVYPSRPPVSHIEFEMDCSRVSEWRLLAAA